MDRGATSRVDTAMSRYPAPRPHLVSVFGALLLGATACNNTAYADRTAPGAIAAAPAPYSIEILDEMGLPTTAYHHRGRTYVMGQAGERYVVRVTNPTPRRIEAMISIDGLDAVDGEPADMRKRGYVIQPYGELRVEGFRVSTEQVASFRFSSVGNSYAGRKGKARNVGVIGVAIFEEQGPPQMALGQAAPEGQGYYRGGGGAGDDRDQAAPSAPGKDFGGATGGDPRSAPEPRAAERADAAKSSGRIEASRSRAPSMNEEAGAPADSACCQPPPSARPGLGTEFGEYRYSAVSWTQFVRTHPVQPSAVLELRYNDAPGLQALGIRLVHESDIVTREAATPFPGDPHFAQPPR
jgi:hypothetical protein